MFHIVLVEPEIPQNTGNIARTCAVTGAALHLVRPLGFSTDDKSLKRAGLDYWHSLTLFYHDSIEEVWAQYPDARFFYCSTHAANRYDKVRFSDGDFLVFGKETAGLPKPLLMAHADEAIRTVTGGTGLVKTIDELDATFQALSLQHSECTKKIKKGLGW